MNAPAHAAPRTASSQLDDDFFSPLENTKPFLKAAFEGFAGSGKTHTAAEVVVGLHRKIGSTKPVAIFDTEEAAKFLRPRFEAAGIRVLHKRSRSMADLRETMARLRDLALADVLLIDSLTHIWEDFVEAYKAKTNRRRLEFQDWSIIKPTWKREFSDPFVRDPYHIIATGRAGYEYSDERDEETGKREIFKSGIKMKAEGETAYEADVLVLMERHEEVLDPKRKRVYRTATILKDRSTLIDGKTFENPSFAHFEPAIDLMLADPSKGRPGSTVERSAGDLFRTEEDRRSYFKRRDILLEKIEAALVEAWPGQAAEAKRAKVEALAAGFGTTSWTEVTTLALEVLETRLPALLDFIAKRTGRAPVTTAAPVVRAAPAPSAPPSGEVEELQARANEVETVRRIDGAASTATGSLAERLGVPPGSHELADPAPAAPAPPSPSPIPDPKTAGPASAPTAPAPPSHPAPEPEPRCRICGGELDGGHMGEECPNETQAEEEARHARERAPKDATPTPAAGVPAPAPSRVTEAELLAAWPDKPQFCADLERELRNKGPEEISLESLRLPKLLQELGYDRKVLAGWWDEVGGAWRMSAPDKNGRTRRVDVEPLTVSKLERFLRRAVEGRTKPGAPAGGAVAPGRVSQGPPPVGESVSATTPDAARTDDGMGFVKQRTAEVLAMIGEGQVRHAEDAAKVLVAPTGGLAPVSLAVARLLVPSLTKARVFSAWRAHGGEVVERDGAEDLGAPLSGTQFAAFWRDVARSA